jgi:hypothetical protein
MMPYCTEADLNLLWGRANIKKWSNVDGKTTQEDIAARIALAISSADERIDNELRSHYTLPFDPVPLEIKLLSTKLAGVFLYRFPRAIAAGDDESVLIGDVQDEADDVLNRLKLRLLKLTSARTTDTPGVFNTTIQTDE